MGTKLGTHLCLCTEVAGEQDLAVQSFVFAKAVLHEDRCCLKWHMTDNGTKFTKRPICRAQLFTLRQTVASIELFALFS